MQAAHNIQCRPSQIVAWQAEAAGMYACASATFRKTPQLRIAALQKHGFDTLVPVSLYFTTNHRALCRSFIIISRTCAMKLELVCRPVPPRMMRMPAAQPCKANQQPRSAGAQQCGAYTYGSRAGACRLQVTQPRDGRRLADRGQTGGRRSGTWPRSPAAFASATARASS